MSMLIQGGEKLFHPVNCNKNLALGHFSTYNLKYVTIEFSKDFIV